MQCEICQHNVATIHLQEVVNGKAKALHLCSECATREGADLGMGMMKGFSLADFLAGVAEVEVEDAAPEDVREDADLACPSCGMCLSMVQEAGLLGCADCYDTFAELLEQVLPTMHAGAVHVGKVCGDDGGEADAVPLAAGVQRELLEMELQDAVAAEAYEDAARLRDAIERLAADGD